MIRHLLLASILFTAICAGCAGGPPPLEERYKVQKVDNPYVGLAGQPTAVMVWADWRMRTEYNRIQYDLAMFFQNRLVPPIPPADPLGDKDKEKERQEKEKERNKKEADKALPRFINAGSVVRFQREHPEIEGQPIEKVAPRLGTTRVVFIEIEDFELQPPNSQTILKGSATANLRVLEIVGGNAKVAREELKIEIHFPPDAPEGVFPADKYTLRSVYMGTLGRLGETLAARFAEFE